MKQKRELKGGPVKNQKLPNETGADDKESFTIDNIFKLNQWGVRKAASRHLSEIFHCDSADEPRLNQRIDFQKFANRTNSCSNSFVYVREVDENTGEIKPKLKYTTACHVRLCPLCQWRRNRIWTNRIIDAYPQIMALYPKFGFILLTLTDKACEVGELRQTIKHFNSSWRRLFRRKELSAVKGWIKTIRVTRENDGLAHPHFHCLLMVEPRYFGRGYIKHDRWVELWRETAKLDYDPQVDIRAIKSKNRPGEASYSILPNGFADMLEYAVDIKNLVAEPDGETGEWVRELANQLHRTRAIESSGILREVFRKIGMNIEKNQEE